MNLKVTKISKMKSIPILILFALLLSILNSCDDKYADNPTPDFTLPVPPKGLQNDCLIRSYGPHIVGQNIYFVYAAAILNGKITSVQVEASIPGGPGTYLENKSYHTDGSGNDVGVKIGEASENNGNITQELVTNDTNAVALRYYYEVPEAARNKKVKFTFTAMSNNGKGISYKMGPYNISKMDIVRNLQLKDGKKCYISIEDGKVYDSLEAAERADKIDLVYLYRNFSDKEFNHSLVAPGADPEYLIGINLPQGLKRDTKIRKTWDLQDRDLAGLRYRIYVTDLDFQTIDLSHSPDFAINLKTQAGCWIETADNKYKAYIYVNSVNSDDSTAIVSMKRYPIN